jgi:hypothetical protein
MSLGDTEEAVDADDDHVAGTDEVDEGGLHPGRAGAGHRERESVGRRPHGPKPVAGLVEQGDEGGVEVTEQRPAEAGGRLRIRVARAGTHQDALGYRHGSRC